MIKLIGTIFKVTNICVVAVYLSACLIPFLPAGKFWMIAILGLVFPFLFLSVAIFFIGWLFARSRWCLLSLSALILSWQQLAVMAGLNTKKEFNLTKTSKTLRILTWNTSSWGGTTKTNKNGDEYYPLMLDVVKKQQADVLCFQEFWDKRNPYVEYSTTRVLKEMGYPYSYFVKTVIDNFTFGIGVVIFSKYKITDSASFAYSGSDFAEHLIYTDIQFDQQKIRVFTTHLQSVQFEKEEYTAISKLKHTDKSGLKDSKTIARKLRNAYQIRGAEADLVQQKIQESPYPVIICGDFNDVPNSYTYFTIKGDLQDAFLKKGTGFGRTFQYLSPTLRIDYILANKKFEVTQFSRITSSYSDHYPLVTDVVLP